MGNSINYNKPEQDVKKVYECKFCRPPTSKSHTTKSHRCSLCGVIGQHGRYEHKNCKLCLENDHITHKHICSTCGKSGHEKMSCNLCNKKDHHMNEHKCSVCGEINHQKSVEEHPICGWCNDNKLKYTHTQDKHVTWLIKNNKIKPTNFENYARCTDCLTIVPIKIVNNERVCKNCNKLVPKYIRCSRNDDMDESYKNYDGLYTYNSCGMKHKNILMWYCHVCGRKITCKKCLDEIHYEGMYDSDDEHGYCTDSL